MKLVRFGSAGQEHPGLIDSGGAVRDLSGVVEDLTPDTLGIEQLQELKDIYNCVQKTTCMLQIVLLHQIYSIY